jgi:Flp pilus assembly protein TadG
MKNKKYHFNKLIASLAKSIFNNSGQVFAIFALALPVFMGAGVLSIDVGHLYVSRNVLQNAADAGAKAGATVLADSNGDQAAATAEATLYANRNIATYSSLNGTATTVTFPSATSVRVTVAHNVPLLLGPVIGFNNGNVTATAVAGFGVTSAIPPGTLVPLAIACNTPGVGLDSDNCYGLMSAEDPPYTERRYCGNYFADGPTGNTCGNPIETGEKFLMGIDFMGSGTKENGTADFREYFYSGYPGPVHWGDPAMALAGNRNGWKGGIIDRIKESYAMDDPYTEIDEGLSRRTVVMPVVKKHPSPIGGSDGYNMMVQGFVAVEMSLYASAGTTDNLTYKVKKKYFSEAEMLQDQGSGGGVGADSVGAVSLIE